MDQIWDRNPSKSDVIGRCRGMKKNELTTQNRQKSNAKIRKEKKRVIEYICQFLHYIKTPKGETIS